MQIINKFISVLLVLSLILPLLADARAGSSYGGSRGGFHSRSYQSGTYNYRPQSNYRAPYYNPQSTTYSNRPTSGSFFSGLFSGLVGGYLYNKIFNSNSQQTEMNKTPAQASSTGHYSFTHILILLLAIYLIWRFTRNRRRNTDFRTHQNLPPQDNFSPSQKMNLKDFINLSPSNSRQSPDISQENSRVFENLLLKIQSAWSEYNLAQLANLTTPDMYDNFANTIKENQQRDITNYVSHVKLLNQEVQDSWNENNALFARVALTWSAVDYAVNKALSPNDPGYLIDGNMNEPTIATEIWTFKKSDQGPWLLADVQQT